MTTDTKDFDYQKLRSSFELNIPSDFNFAFDVLSKNALNSEKIALISIDKNGDDFKNITHKELDDISYAWQFIFTFGVILGIIYSVHHDLKPIYICSSVELCFMVILITMKYIYSKSDCLEDTGDIEKNGGGP